MRGISCSHKRFSSQLADANILAERFNCSERFASAQVVAFRVSFSESIIGRRGGRPNTDKFFDGSGKTGYVNGVSHNNGSGVVHKNDGRTSVADCCSHEGRDTGSELTYCFEYRVCVLAKEFTALYNNCILKAFIPMSADEDIAVEDIFALAQCSISKKVCLAALADIAGSDISGICHREAGSGSTAGPHKHFVGASTDGLGAPTLLPEVARKHSSAFPRLAPEFKGRVYLRSQEAHTTGTSTNEEDDTEDEIPLVFSFSCGTQTSMYRLVPIRL